MRKMEQKNRILIVEDDTDINNLLYGITESRV